MKKIQKDAMPVLRNATKLAATVVPASELKNSGISATYGIRVGDSIEFPDTIEDATIVQQAVRAGGPMQSLVVVMKNNKPSYFSIGACRKVDVRMKGTCDFTENMFTKFEDDEQRLTALCGKTITCAEVVECEFNEFTREGEQTGKTIMKKCPVIVEVNAK